MADHGVANLGRRAVVRRCEIPAEQASALVWPAVQLLDMTTDASSRFLRRSKYQLILTY
jgi:hypothetical protein